MESEIIETFSRGNTEIEVIKDESPSNPRIVFDNLSTILSTDKEIKGDPHEINLDDFNCNDEIALHLIDKHNAVNVSPLCELPLPN
jgi:hypothetical protein